MLPDFSGSTPLLTCTPLCRSVADITGNQEADPAVAGWTFAGEPISPGPSSEIMTLVEGSAFCISRATGDIERGPAHGLFFRDTRLLSHWQLLIDGEPPELLTQLTEEPLAATFVGRSGPRDGLADSTVLVMRKRYVGHGMREDIVVRNLGSSPLRCKLQMSVGSDFADLFEVKEHRVRIHGDHTIVIDGDGLRLERRWRGKSRGTKVEAVGWTANKSGVLAIDITVAPRAEWHGTLQVQPVADGVVGPVDYPSDKPVDHAEPAQRLQQWRRDSPLIHTDHAGLGKLIARTQEDLGALRIFDPEHPGRV